MRHDKETIYQYLLKLFSEYVSPPSELASDIDGKLWKAAHDLATEARCTLCDSPATVKFEVDVCEAHSEGRFRELRKNIAKARELAGLSPQIAIASAER